MMRTEGYAMFRILKTPSGSLLGLTELEEIGIHGGLELCDYVFCPRGDVALLSGAVNIMTGPGSWSARSG